MNIQPLIAVVVGLVVLWLAWKIVKGIVRVVLTVAILAAIAYVVLSSLP